MLDPSSVTGESSLPLSSHTEGGEDAPTAWQPPSEESAAAGSATTTTTAMAMPSPDGDGKVPVSLSSPDDEKDFRSPQASPHSLPTTLSRSYTVLDVDTHTFCQVFSDRIVVGITQLPSRHIGHWVVCHASRSPVDPRAVDYDIATVMGNTHVLGGGGNARGGGGTSRALYEVYARRLTESIIQRGLLPGSDRVVVLLGISLLPQPSSQSQQEPEQEHQSTDESYDMVRFKCIINLLVSDLIQPALGVVVTAKNHS